MYRQALTLMWDDAEGTVAELDIPETRWTVVLTEDNRPAAWCAARIEADGTLKCHSNYETRAHRGRRLYRDAYHGRHRDVILTYNRPAVTYLFAEPIRLHEADGWHQTGQTGTGITGHRWWQLRRKPGSWPHLLDRILDDLTEHPDSSARATSHSEGAGCRAGSVTGHRFT